MIATWGASLTCPFVMKNDKPCGRPIPDARTNLCLFHTPTKDPDEFRKGFLEIIDKAGPHGMLDFSGFVFSAMTFQDRTFRNWMDFSGATFTGPLNFYGCTFRSTANFWKARFNDYVLLHKCVCKGQIQFQRATFRGMFECLEVTFESLADFYGTIFEGEASIRNVQFGTEAHDPNQASPMAIFTQAQFRGGAQFANLTFRCDTSFASASFEGLAFFEDLALAERTGVVGHEEKLRVDFTNVRVAREDGVQFVGRAGKDFRPQPLDVSRFRFAFSDMARMRFENVRWDQPAAVAVYGRDGEGGTVTRVSDEEDLELGYMRDGTRDRFEIGLEPEHVAHIYKGLRTSYERHLFYAEAGAFHVRDMEMRRLALGAKAKTRRRAWWRRNLSLLSLYRLLSNYGESYTRPLIWSLVVVALFAAGYYRLGLPPKDAALESLLSFLPSVDTIGTTWWVVIERVFGIALLTFLTLALHRRFKR